MSKLTIRHDIYLILFEYMVSIGVKQSLATHRADVLTDKLMNELNRFLQTEQRKSNETTK